jgi:glutamine---fructose-6-phosphate transaminase (isomerizing)
VQCGAAGRSRIAAAAAPAIVFERAEAMSRPSFSEGVGAQPANLVEAGEEMLAALAHAELAPLRQGVVVFSGIGASWHALLPSVRWLRAAGRRAFALSAPELAATRGLADGYVLVSQSGESAELLAALEVLPLERLVALTARSESTLARAADVVLPLSARQDSAVSSLSYTATLQALGMLSEELAGDGQRVGWREVAEDAARSLERHRGDAEVLAKQLIGATTLDVVAATASLASAGESALLVREAIRLPAAHEETRQYLHGPLEAVREGFSCLLFGAARELELAGTLSGYGAASCLVTAAQDPVPSGVHAIRIAACPELAAPILEIVPVQLAVLAAAAALELPVEELMRQQSDTKVAPAA